MNELKPLKMQRKPLKKGRFIHKNHFKSQEHHLSSGVNSFIKAKKYFPPKPSSD